MLLLSIACERDVYDVPNSLVERGEPGIRQPETEIIEEPKIESELEIDEEPEVKVRATETRAELMLNTTLTCTVTGEGPYFYRWKINGKIVDCEGAECNIQLKEIGEYVVGCEVSAGEQTGYEAALVEVIPEYVNIEEIYVLGDSLSAGTGTLNHITENWAYLLSESYNAELYNYAIPGATTGSAADSQMKAFKQQNLSNELVFLWVGANDILYFNELGSFARAYEDIVVNLTEKSDDVILVTIPDVSALDVAIEVEEEINELAKEFGFNVRIPVKNIGREILGSYNDAIKAIAEKHELPVVDMFEHMKELNQSYVSEDRFHPNRQGHAELANRLKEDIEDFYPRAELS